MAFMTGAFVLSGPLSYPHYLDGQGGYACEQSWLLWPGLLYCLHFQTGYCYLLRLLLYLHNIFEKPAVC